MSGIGSTIQQPVNHSWETGRFSVSKGNDASVLINNGEDIRVLSEAVEI